MTAAAGTPGDFAGLAGRRVDTWLIVWLVMAVFVTACMFPAYVGKLDWLMALPKEWLPPIDEHLNYLMREIFVPVFKPVFRALAFVLELLMVNLRDLLQWLPWPVIVVATTIMAHAAAGWRLALFTCLSLLYMVVVGYWDESMVTLALVGISIPLSASIGLFLGLWGARSARARRVLGPVLDVMQTVPTFAYLTPLILLLGYGPVVGLIASAIFAIPPMVRNVMVSVAGVPINIVESGDMAGCTRRQLTWWVQVPAAMPGIMLGLNQCVMAALSMVIIASIIGGLADIGWEVLSAAITH